MPTLPEFLALAFQHHQAGRLPEAEQLYSQILQIDPQNLDACHLLGVLAYQAGQHQVAIQYLSRAIEIKPDHPEAHYHLGNVHQRQGKWTAAAACYRRVLELRPDHADAHFDLGNVLNELGQLPESVASYLEAIKLRPAFVEACVNAGIVLRKQGQLEAAIHCFRQAIKLDAANAQAHYCLGLAYFDNDNAPEAIACYRRALETNPNDADVWNQLGIAQKELEQLDDAIANYRQAAALAPAEHKFQCNLAIAFQDAGKLDEADAAFQQALKLKPDSPEVHWNWSHLKLLRGDFQNGWPGYEWRWKLGAPVREFRQPLWDGRPLNGQTILLHTEQGFGDTFQFIRYAAVVQELEARVVVECQRPLAKVMARCPGIDRLIAAGDELPDFDVQAPLLSLPGILKTDLSTIPAEIPYLFADKSLVADWRLKLEQIQGVRIGIHWQSKPGKEIFRRRDIPLEYFASLARIPGVQLLSLQKGAATAKLASDSDRPAIIDFGDELDGSHGPFMDTAAIMMNLDLVITCDTSIAHLAGALGVPVWLALPFAPDWRWLLDRTDSPWYPTMRLFRQKSRGDWAAVFQEIHSALHELISSDGKRP